MREFVNKGDAVSRPRACDGRMKRQMDGCTSFDFELEILEEEQMHWAVQHTTVLYAGTVLLYTLSMYLLSMLTVLTVTVLTL